jgi:serine/threonine protein phosphatase PrpC
MILTGGEDAFLLCTDGFWEYVYEEEMEKALQESQDPQQWLEKMKTLVCSRTPQDNDNFTAAAVFC